MSSSRFTRALAGRLSVGLSTTLFLLGCAHQSITEPKPVMTETQAEQARTPAASEPTLASPPSKTIVHSIPQAAPEWPGNCSAHCPEILWECACAFALKTESYPTCKEDFGQDHATFCDDETLEECLMIVLRAAQGRYDSELAKATAEALQCVRAEVGHLNETKNNR